MIGAEGVVEIARSFLEARLPAKLTEIEGRLGLAAGAIAPPGLYTGEDRPQLAFEEWPALMVVPLDVPDVSSVDLVNGADEVFLSTYRLRIFVYARAEGFAETAAAVRRLMLGVREVLFANPTMASNGVALIDKGRGRYRESYSDLDVDKAGRSIAGAFAEVQVKIEETVTVSDRGAVTDAIVTGVGAHPALD